ncbi:MAG: hypothetical protein WBB15_08005 [Ornithinimicrobium sp.]
MPDKVQTVVELLSAALTPGSPGLSSHLEALADALVVAVPSFLGFNVHTDDVSFSWGPGLPVRPGEPIHAASTLRWVITQATPEPIELVLFAGLPGAWVDLSADLVWLTRCPPQRLILDQDLTATVPIVSADLVNTSAVNQAIGALVALGYSSPEAAVELDAKARADGTDRVTAAATLLDDLPRRPPEPV